MPKSRIEPVSALTSHPWGPREPLEICGPRLYACGTPLALSPGRKMTATGRRQTQLSEQLPAIGDYPSGHRIKAELPRAVHYRLCWAYEELEFPAGTEFSVGRAKECLLRLTSARVSRHHARFSHGSEGPAIEDLGSLNGVLVNNRKVTGPTCLRHGDTVGIGEEQIKLVDVDIVAALARQSTLRVGPRQLSAAGSPRAASQPPSLAALSPRERKVFALLVQGHSPGEIAERLRLDESTVERLRSRIAEQLDCSTRADLVTYAICAGLLRRI